MPLTAPGDKTGSYDTYADIKSRPAWITAAGEAWASDELKANLAAQIEGKRPRRVTVLRCGPKCIGHYLIVSVSVNPKLKVSGLLRLRRLRRVATWALRTIHEPVIYTDLFGPLWAGFSIIRNRLIAQKWRWTVSCFWSASIALIRDRS